MITDTTQREDLISLIQSVRDGVPIRIDSSVALRMIDVRVHEAIEDTTDVEQLRAALCDVLDIIARAN